MIRNCVDEKCPCNGVLSEPGMVKARRQYTRGIPSEQLAEPTYVALGPSRERPLKRIRLKRRYKVDAHASIWVVPRIVFVP